MVYKDNEKGIDTLAATTRIFIRISGFAQGILLFGLFCVVVGVTMFTQPLYEFFGIDFEVSDFKSDIDVLLLSIGFFIMEIFAFSTMAKRRAMLLSWR